MVGPTARRNSYWKAIGTLACFLILTSQAQCDAADQAPSEDSPVSPLLEQFHSPKSADRAQAFYRLLDLGASGRFDGRTWLMPSILNKVFAAFPKQADRIRVDLFRLLEHEDSVVETSRQRFERSRGKTRLTEDYTNYWGDLVAAVSSLDDPRALNGLIGAINTGGMAERALVRLGDVALDRVIERYENGDDITRMSATRIISQMLEPGRRPVGSDTLPFKKIKERLLQAASDKNPFVRKAAVEGLARLRNPEAKQVLEKLASEDPYEASQHGGPKGVYPVRNAAKSALNRKD